MTDTDQNIDWDASWTPRESDDDDSPHDIEEDGKFYSCTKCGKLATNPRKLKQTECTDDS